MITTAGAAAPAPNREMKMKNFTIFFRSAADGITGSVHVEASEIAEAHDAFQGEYPNTELIGAFEGHVMPLWWEEP